MDGIDVLYFLLPALAFVVAVAGLLYYWPWPPKVLLNRERTRVRLLDVVKVSHDTKRYRMSTGESGTVLGVPVGKQLTVFAPNPAAGLSSGQWNGSHDPDKGSSEVSRPYTPITGDETAGYFDIVVKTYKPGKSKMVDGTMAVWEDGGKVSQYLDSRVPGDFIEVNGPGGTFEYLGGGMFKLPAQTLTVKHVCMVAGGSGITTMLRVLRAAVRDKHDNCRFTLLYANKTEDDILLREAIEEVVEQGKGQVNVVYTLESPPPKWSHETGLVACDMFRRHFPAPRRKGIEPLIVLCGRSGMTDLCKKNLETLGYPRSAVLTL